MIWFLLSVSMIIIVSPGDAVILNRRRIVSSFFPGTAGSYDSVVRMFTLGLDSHWKREIYNRVPPSKRILDLACGTGIVTLGLARRQPGAEILGVDITGDYLALYEERLRSHPGVKGGFLWGDAETVRLEGEFDAVVSSYLAKYVDPGLLLRNVSPHLRSGGVFVVHDFTLPGNGFFRAAWSLYNRVMNLLGGRLFPEWRGVFDSNLTNLIRRTGWFDTFPMELERNGFYEIRRKSLSFGSAGLIWAKKI